ncbi:TIGR03564 family F420-dependent LLM class oxidoreductase [Cryptosporangium aurantiacum]|uniref:F420-dependent oxidoreductase, MSMEG_4879 family n=1 Tax=Cryptosporangium aurantiacum TaxID=134849 RepID=A0A1M7K8L3_9ACTN|nr:TIGR03564 family F420-dependent LLM class oxidoreductase [Cryptosporangium aurantiacum]SHM61629.1 F420-dependent oxidoreductase, MSMEG_4879 family [Cryptosporangium aurantiacum]
MTTGIAVADFDPTVPNYVDAILRHARAARDAGVRSLWFAQRFDYDATTLATVVARELPEVRVGTSAIPVFGRQPVLVANQAQVAQAATGGRFRLGLALGTKDTVERTFGIGFDRPIAVLREFLTALRTLLETGNAEFHGELVTADPPWPITLAGATPPPLLVAAMGPQALRATGELADGTLPYLAGPRTLAEEIVPTITAAAERAGRPAPQIVALLPGALVSDLDAAREAAAQQLAFYDQVPSYQRVVAREGLGSAAELAVLGDEKTLEDAIRRYRDAGATEVVVTQTHFGGPADQQRTYEFLGSLTEDPAGASPADAAAVPRQA